MVLWMGSVKAKLKAMRGRSRANYGKVEKTDSMRVEIRSRRAQKLIERTLKTAEDSPRRKVSSSKSVGLPF